MAVWTCRGRVALVTGASRGIGAAIAQRLAAEGAAVAVTARTRSEGDAKLAGALDTTVEAIEAMGGVATAIQADLADADDRARIVPEAAAALGPIDILVNNAAAAFYLPAAEIPLRRRRTLLELNFHAPVDLIQQVLPSMKERRAGWILNISSATARHPARGSRAYRLGTTTTAYGASKAALERYTTGLAAEVDGDGIAVNALSPVAAVRTPGAEVLVGDLMDAHPELVEPLETFVDAALVLCTCDPAELSGRVLVSRDVPVRG